ncbi:MAG: hypothetical protein H0X44_00825 [Acidobacteria bacterium]|nr:hypothetical protein [Acidobacteriota bacterium]
MSKKASKKKAARRPAPARKASARKSKKTAPKKTAPRKSAKAAKAKTAKARRPVVKARVIRKAAKPAPPKKTRKAPAAAKAVARKPLPRNAATAKLNAAAEKKLPALNRERRRLAENDGELMPSAPSTLGYASGSSAARSGRGELREALSEHTETSPALTGGDIDADWEDAYAVGDEAPGGDNPTPDQDRVDDIGKALGVQYADNEELKGAEKIIERDRHRWELDPASSDDYKDRAKDED